MSIKLFLFKSRLPLMQKALDAYSLRLRTISENIANSQTAGYTPKRVVFEELFKKSIKEYQKEIERVDKEKGDFNQQNIPNPKIEVANIEKKLEYQSGQSHINIDEEMANLAETQIRFRFVARLLRRYFSGLNSAISGIRES
ncbi:MAG: flagellar basal body rod protein FlgB [Ignavibacteria bacterium]|nr:flagellar basal body rod protein FlgB [Ignavibacteria bacterium]